jgi:hypothetical protein
LNAASRTASVAIDRFMAMLLLVRTAGRRLPDLTVV